MKKSQRHTISLILIAIYLLAVFSPIAPLVMHSTAGECSGNCSADGCSLERRAAQTCCCWQKKQLASNLPQEKFNASCCATKQSQVAPPPIPKVSCCPPGNSDTSREHIESASTSSTTTIISTGTCGNSRLLDTAAPGNTPHLPYFFVKAGPSPRQSTLTFTQPKRLASLHGKPPDPPPKLV